MDSRGTLRKASSRGPYRQGPELGAVRLGHSLGLEQPAPGIEDEGLPKAQLICYRRSARLANRHRRIRSFHV